MKITLLTGPTFDFRERFGFDIKVVKSPLAKRLTIRIDEKNHRPVLTIPKYCSQRRALQFLEDNRDWMINMLARLPKSQLFGNNDQVSFFGEIFKILWAENQKGTVFENGLLKVGGRQEFLHRRVTDFLKEQALQRFSTLTVEKAKLLGCRVCGVAIRDTKSRWGSCSTRGNINYNWRVSMAPLYVIDYLVCHEVTHLKHPDHSKNFWKTLSSICPQYQEGRRWLKVKGKDLYCYK